MNKKQLIVAAIAAVLSVSSANATSTISGVTNGGSGSFDIHALQVNGDVGFRYYDQFNLGKGDIANLIYKAQNGDQRALETFINLVGDKIDINGIVNTMRDGNFHNGHAVFISPKGMVVGASGVLNVGTLSVVTPTQTKFNSLKSDYDSAKFDVISNISQLRNGTGMNDGGNARVDIQGKILTRGTGDNTSGIGVDIRGSQVDISGTIVNGYKGNDAFTVRSTAEAQAEALFNKLVNTDGTIKAGSSMIADDAGRVVIKSGADVSSTNRGGINITGKVANLGNTETAITNHGSNGLQVAGTVATNGKLNVYNNNTASALTVSGNLINKNANLSLSSKGGIDVQSGANITTDRNIEIVNKGGQLAFAGTAVAQGKTDIVNSGANGMNISGTVGNTANATDTVRIVNENGKLTFTGKAYARDSVSFRNQDKASGMDIAGTVKAGEGVLIDNGNGNAYLNGSIDVAKGVTLADGTENVAVAIINRGNGKLNTGSNSRITVEQGNIAIKNTGLNGMALNGTINNKNGETAINNTAGAMTVAGNITNKGNMGIINRGTGEMNVNGAIDNTGKLKLANVNGEAFNVDGTITNRNGNLSISNYNGDFAIDGNVTNSDGYLFVYSRDNSNGLRTGVDSTIKNTNGDLAIKHNGKGTTATGSGLDLNGNVIKSGTGELAINNYTGDLNVGGKITTDSKTGIINRNGAGDMEVNAVINSTTNKELRIKNEAGTGDITVNGTITHDGRLNILNNDGTLTLGGTINNEGTDRSYAISKGNADGIDVTNSFNANSTDGMIYILNKTGANGLNYAGTATSTNGQVEIYNKAGNMNVTGDMNGHPAVILNTGDKLTVTDKANLQGDVKIVNKGSEKADVADKYKDNFRESLKK